MGVDHFLNTEKANNNLTKYAGNAIAPLPGFEPRYSAVMSCSYVKRFDTQKLWGGKVSTEETCTKQVWTIKLLTGFRGREVKGKI